MIALVSLAPSGIYFQGERCTNEPVIPNCSTTQPHVSKLPKYLTCTPETCPCTTCRGAEEPQTASQHAPLVDIKDREQQHVQWSM